MPRSITFILPRLADPHCLSFLDEECQQLMEQLNVFIKRSKRSHLADHNAWISKHLGISQTHKGSADLMIVGEGVTDTDSSYWLRADPVMLTATHNGILCRGNRVLNITDEERHSLELLVNDYFCDEAMTLVLSNVKQGYLKFNQRVDCEFVPLADVLGQDISQRLPKEQKWHGLLTDFQMLLHNCDVNQRRSERGQPTINGFWVWGKTHDSFFDIKNDIKNDNINCNDAEVFYTDEISLAGALNKRENLVTLPEEFEAGKFVNEDICIHVSELEEAFIQNDMDGWNEIYKHWIKNWVLPAMLSVDAHELTAVNLMTGDGYQYQYNAYSKWCFWRRNDFNKNLTKQP